MKLRNTFTNTEPIVFHAPGATRRSALWGELQQGAAEHCLRLPPAPAGAPSCAVITWNTSSGQSILETCLQAMDEPHTVLGRETENWQNRDKIQLTLDAIQGLDADIIVGLDAWDVVLLDRPSEIADRFDLMPYLMVFNASPMPWPHDHAEPLAQPTIDYEYTLRGKYRHLNAGAWVARREMALQLFTAALEVDTSKSRYPWSEQLAVRAAWDRLGFHQNDTTFSAIGLDMSCQIFQHMRGKGDLTRVD